MGENRDQQKQWAQVVARAGVDLEFRNRLLANPKQVLAGIGLEMPEGVEVAVVENTDRRFHLVLPQLEAELSDEQLEAVAGGVSPDRAHIWPINGTHVQL